MSRDDLGKRRAIPMCCSALWGWDSDCSLVTLPCYPLTLLPLSESFHTRVRNIRSPDMAGLIFQCAQRTDVCPEVCLTTV